MVTNSAGAFTLQYDLNGNLTNDGNGLVYEYDAADRTTAIIRNTTDRTEFAYDGLGRRVQVIEKQSGTAISTNKYVWCGTELCEERNNTGAMVMKRFFGQGEQISGTNYFYTIDHLGSIREMTDLSGAVRARYVYDPYGKRTKVAGDIAANFGYTGHFMLASQPDHTLTLYRLYRPDLGRWCSRDPLAENAGLNLYAYVLGDPLNALDPLGLDILDFLSNHAAESYQSGGFFGNAEGILANSLEAALSLIGAQQVKELATKAGEMEGYGCEGAGLYKAATVGLIALNAIPGLGKIAGKAAQKLFLSEMFGVVSAKFGSSKVVGLSGAWNTAQTFLKVGWSSAKQGGGWAFRIGIGISKKNPNEALFHLQIPGTFVPNAFADGVVAVKQWLYKHP